MVCEWGMSEEVGPITFGKGEEQIFLGKEISKPKNYSEETAIAIDKEIKSILTGNYEKARTLLENNIDLLHKIAEVLLDIEVIDGKGLDEIIKNHKPEQYTSSLENPFSPKGSMAFRDNNIKDT
jgi:cell division protease FtsH